MLCDLMLVLEKQFVYSIFNSIVMGKNKGSVHVSVDIEADGPIVGKHSMISFGMVIVEEGFKRGFYRELKPIGDEYVPEALGVSGFTRSETLKFMPPVQAMLEASQWLTENIQGKPIMWADNPGFDKSWMHWYFLTFTGNDPFGHSSRRIADFICGIEGDLRFKWKHLRKTKHSHNALADATGNAEVLLHYFEKANIKY